MTSDVSPPRHAVVLTAGLGTRLRPLTDVRAKPAVPVAGEPMIRRILRWLVTSGVDDLVLNLHHRPESLTMLVGDGTDLGARVRYSWEQPLVLGSAGGVRQALPILGADTVLVVNGDTLTDLDLSALASAHASSDALVTLGLVPNVDPHRYGGVRLDAAGVVTGFATRGAAAEGSWHFIGVQMASASVFAPLPAGQAANSIGGVYDAVIAAWPGAIRGFTCEARFWDVGTPSDYVRTSAAFAENPASSPIGQRARIDASARIERSILWDDIDIGPECLVEDCIVTDRVELPRGAAYRRQILVASNDGIRASPIDFVA